MAIVFFSYSHSDERLRDRVELALKLLHREGLVEAWHDRRISPGDEVDHSIAVEMERADIVLLLLSPDFLGSDYCFDREMRRALERHRAGQTRVIPIILRPCDWLNSELRTLLALPPDGKPVTSFPDIDDAMLTISNGIRKVIGASGAPGRNPPSGAWRTPERSTPAAAAPGPRSSDLQLPRRFTDADKDRFQDEAFEYLATFFENSLQELTVRNEGVGGRFKRIDTQQFTGVVYRDGHKVGYCRIFMGSDAMLRGIAFSGSESIGNGFNESLSVDVHENDLTLKTLNMSSHRNGPRHLTFNGAAEMLWSLFMRNVRS